MSKRRANAIAIIMIIAVATTFTPVTYRAVVNSASGISAPDAIETMPMHAAVTARRQNGIAISYLTS